MELAAQAIECEPSVLLSLELTVRAELGVCAGCERGRQTREHDPEDRHHRYQLDERVPAFAFESTPKTLDSRAT